MKLCQGMINWEIIPVEPEQKAKEHSDVSEIEISFLSNDDSWFCLLRSALRSRESIRQSVFTPCLLCSTLCTGCSLWPTCCALSPGSWELGRRPCCFPHAHFTDGNTETLSRELVSGNDQNQTLVIPLCNWCPFPCTKLPIENWKQIKTNEKTHRNYFLKLLAVGDVMGG